MLKTAGYGDKPRPGDLPPYFLVDVEGGYAQAYSTRDAAEEAHYRLGGDTDAEILEASVGDEGDLFYAALWGDPYGTEGHPATGLRGYDLLAYIPWKKSQSGIPADDVPSMLLFSYDHDPDTDEIFPLGDDDLDQLADVEPTAKLFRRVAEDPLRYELTTRAMVKKSSRQDVAQALAQINAYRARKSLRPLDPVAAGWTDQDILDEAKRLRSPNPTTDLRHRLL